MVLKKRSQELPSAYVVNGSFYLTTPKELRARHSFIGEKTIPLLIESPKESLDIDIEWDWFVAESIIKRKIRRSFRIKALSRDLKLNVTR